MIQPNVTETEIFKAFRAFLRTIVDCEVIRTPVNRAAMPKGDFIALSPGASTALATPVVTGSDLTQNIKRSTQFTFQMDCYGAGAHDRALTIAMLMRTSVACDGLTASGLDIQPLFASDAQQMPIVTGEEQYLERWTLQVHLQYNPVLSMPRESATSLSMGTLSVDRTYKH